MKEQRKISLDRKLEGNGSELVRVDNGNFLMLNGITQAKGKAMNKVSETTEDEREHQ